MLGSLFLHHYKARDLLFLLVQMGLIMSGGNFYVKIIWIQEDPCLNHCFCPTQNQASFISVEYSVGINGNSWSILKGTEAAKLSEWTCSFASRPFLFFIIPQQQGRVARMWAGTGQSFKCNDSESQCSPLNWCTA